MANRYPLIANSSANQIQELASSDNIDLTGNYIVGVVGVNASGIITATSFVGDITGDVTGNASGLTGTPDITVRNITGVAATFSGVITYEDVTNVDSVGIVTAGNGFRATTGGLIVTAGVSTLSDGVNISGITTVGILTSYESITIKVGAGSTEVATALNTKASTGKAIAMAMVFG